MRHRILLVMSIVIGAGCGTAARPVPAPVPGREIAEAPLSPAECGRLVEHIFETTFSEATPAAREAARESEYVRMTMARMRQLCDAEMPRPLYRCFMSARQRAEVQACTRRFGPPDRPQRPTPRPGEYEALLQRPRFSART